MKCIFLESKLVDVKSSVLLDVNGEKDFFLFVKIKVIFINFEEKFFKVDLYSYNVV